MRGCPRSYIYHDIEQNKIVVHEVTTEDKQSWWDGLSEAKKMMSNCYQALTQISFTYAQVLEFKKGMDKR